MMETANNIQDFLRLLCTGKVCCSFETGYGRIFYKDLYAVEVFESLAELLKFCAFKEKSNEAFFFHFVN